MKNDNLPYVLWIFWRNGDRRNGITWDYENHMTEKDFKLAEARIETRSDLAEWAHLQNDERPIYRLIALIAREAIREKAHENRGKAWAGLERRTIFSR